MKHFLLVVLGLGVLGAGAWFGRVWWTRFFTPPQPVKIGYVGPLSGDVSIDGYSVQKALELARHELNATYIEIVPMDSRCEADRATAAVTSLISQRVVAIVGDICSSATIEMVPLVEKAGIPLISPASTSPALSGISPNFFRTIPSDDLQGKFAAELLIKRGFKKIMVFYTDEPYGKGFFEVLQRHFSVNGHTLVGVPLVMGKLALTREVQQVITNKPEAIYIVAADTTTPAALINQIRTKKIMTPIFGSEGLKNELLVANAGEGNTEGLIVSSVSTGTKAFVSLYKADYEIEPATYASQAYDVFRVLDLALAAQRRTHKPLIEIIPTISFEGMSGKVSFDDNHEVTGDYSLWVVQNKKFVPMEE